MIFVLICIIKLTRFVKLLICNEKCYFRNFWCNIVQTRTQKEKGITLDKTYVLLKLDLDPNHSFQR
jgi:hypothetical protein